MEIFGKRPFVLKTAEMGKKRSDIKSLNIDGEHKADEHIKIALDLDQTLRTNLELTQKYAEFYKKLEEITHKMQKLLLKDSDDSLDSLKEQINLFNTTIDKNPAKETYEDDDIDERNAVLARNFEPLEPLDIENETWKKIFGTSETPKASTAKDIAKQRNNSIKTEYNDLNKTKTTCRENKQYLKDIFEKQYKLLNKFVKQIQKAYDKSKKELTKQTSPETKITKLNTKNIQAINQQLQKSLDH